MTEKPLVTVGGLIIASDGTVLLVRSKKWLDLYSLPGGKVELGETRENAFIREVWEETRLKITNLRFAIIQECILSPEFWQDKHFVMNDFIADLDPAYLKEQVQLNNEAYGFTWASPQDALQLPLQRECRTLIQWYIDHLEKKSKNDFGFLGISHHQVSCIIGVYEHERKEKQTLYFDAKIKIDLSRAFRSGQVEDSADYVLIAQICTKMAQSNQYLILEALASDILNEFFCHFPAVWASVTIKKPAAIPTAAYAYVELERGLM